MARITRKELKSDKFALEVGQTVTFFEEHRTLILRYGAAALALAALAFAYMVYGRHQHAARQEALFHAMEAQSAPVGAAAGSAALTFPTQEAKDQEATKRFTEIRNKYPGSEEANIAEFYLGSILTGQGKLTEAEKSYLAVATDSGAQYSSLAKLSLAQIYFADGRADMGEKTLRDLMAHPTMFVTKEQAAIALARNLAAKKPAEARKLLQPLLSKPGEAGQAASTLNNSLPQ
ncbi:MAG: tetratricopeptide repeat protein [Bryobacteraceae bacterium]